jgi:ABC-2 type transport system ATP-binding protein
MTSPYFKERLHEVAQHYQSQDYHLGLRRLLDAALETRNAAIFEKVISFCERSESNGQPSVPEALDLLGSIEQAGAVPAAVKNTSVISAKGVSKLYRKGNFKLSPVDLDLHRGEIVGLVGENGNGKTTLLRILVGELSADTGALNYNLSNPVNNIYERRTRLTFIPQRIPRWWGTLTDNLQFATRHYGIKGKENELWVQMIIARLGLRPYKHLSWGTISSGYRTRFEIAKTLLRQPEVMLLDEPLANLDIISQQTILQDLRFLAVSQAHPMAVVLSSQQIYEVEKVSDRIVFLKQGSPIYQDLRKQKGEEDKVLFEIETTATREQLTEIFKTLPLEQISFNGGVFIASFSGNTSTAEVMKALSASAFETMYFRNISKSSRRFFANL